MLVSFTVRNFKSFRDEATLEMVPGKSRNKTDHVRNDCLKVASIYGANASGKSSLVDAIRTLKAIVTDPSYYGREPLYNWGSGEKVTSFEIVFTVKSLQYRYVLDVESVGINQERPSKCIFIYPVRRECLYVSDLRYESDKHGNIVEDVIIERDIEPDSLEQQLLDYYDNYSRLQFNLDRCNILLIKQAYDKLDTNRDELISTIIQKMQSIPTIADSIHQTKQNIESVLDTEELHDRIRAYRAQLHSIADFDRDGCNLETDRYQKRINRIRQKIVEQGDSIKPVIEKINSHPSTINAYLHKGIRDSHIANVFDWFSKGLIVIDTSDICIPDDLEQVSVILESMDLGFSSIKWKPLTKENGLKVIDELSFNDRSRLQNAEESSINNRMSSSIILKTRSGIYRFEFNKGSLRVDELIPVRDGVGPNRLYSESDGTVRIIELASILTYTDDETAYVIDELDRRLHPMLTRRFIELYLEDKSPNKQLIFTTHETEILTTDLFRKDEIWFVEKKDGHSSIEPLDAISDINYNKRLERLYLEDGVLPGIPR